MKKTNRRGPVSLHIRGYQPLRFFTGALPASVMFQTKTGCKHTMISFVKGTIAYIGDSFILLNCHDVGFHITMPANDLYHLNEGMETTIYTHMAVKEDDISLFGFLNMEELKMFRQLISVSGIGPKGALGILSNITVEELIMAISAGDAKLISSSKGIGLKTAQKLVVDLKGKFKNEVSAISASGNRNTNNNIETAIMFAESTGITRSLCMKALSNVEIPEDADVDAVIDLIFMHLSTK